MFLLGHKISTTQDEQDPKKKKGKFADTYKQRLQSNALFNNEI